MKEITGWVVEKPAGGNNYFYYDVTSKYFSRHPFIYNTLIYATNVCERIKEGVVLPITYTVKRPVYEWVVIATGPLGAHLWGVGNDESYIMDTLMQEMDKGNIKREKNVWYIKKEVCSES